MISTPSGTGKQVTAESALRALWARSDRTRSIRIRLYGVLREAIIRLHLYPGQLLSEKEIAEIFAVSRQPVREAFIRLSEAGLLEVRPQRGTFVVAISRRAVLEARFVREAVEAAVASEAAVKGLDPAVLAELHELVARQRWCLESCDYDRFFALDESLHRTLLLGLEHDAAWRVTEEVKAQLDRVRYLSLPDTTPMAKLIDQHEAIVVAIENRDPVAAEAAMRTHQREILQSLPELMERFPEMFDRPWSEAIVALGAEPN